MKYKEIKRNGSKEKIKPKTEIKITTKQFVFDTRIKNIKLFGFQVNSSLTFERTTKKTQLFVRHDF